MCLIKIAMGITYYDNVEIKKIDCEYTYAMPIAILIRHMMSFDNILIVVRWQSDVIEVSFDIHVCNVVL
jgi:hypothetical protein